MSNLPTEHHEWLSARDVAEIYGITRANAYRALSARTWRNHALAVREIQGQRGGGRGGTMLQVRADTLPPPDRVHLKIEGPTPRTARQDKGRKRVVIGREWDRAVREAGFDDATMEWIRAELAADRNHQWQTRGLRIGWRRIAFDPRTGLRDKLKALTVEAGWSGDLKALHRFCKVPRRFVEERRAENRMVALHDRDRKTFKDTVEYHARRDWSLLQPMEWVSFDVHPHDFLLERPDGGTFTCKLIAALDGGTGRFRVEPVFLERRGGVTQQHVARFLANMMADPAWGVPLIAQRDNGGEFNILDRLHDLLRATHIARTGRDCPEVVDEFRHWGISNSLPYNGQAKPIEPAFARLERIVSESRAYIGGDRMLKPTENVGRKPVPFDGGKAAFLELLSGWVETYNGLPFQGGPFEGRSPVQVWNGHVSGGWQPVLATVEETLVAFHRIEKRTVRQGSISIGKKRYRLPEVVPPGEVEVMLPIWETDVIGVKGDGGRVLAVWPDAMRDPRDLTGAKAAGQGEKDARKAVAETRATADPIDGGRVPAHLVTGADAALKADEAGRVNVTADVSDFGKAIAKTPKQRKADDEQRKADAEAAAHERRRRHLKRLEKRQKRTGTGG